MEFHHILHRNKLILELFEWIQRKACSTHTPVQNENRIRAHWDLCLRCLQNGVVKWNLTKFAKPNRNLKLSYWTMLRSKLQKCAIITRYNVACEFENVVFLEKFTNSFPCIFCSERIKTKPTKLSSKSVTFQLRMSIRFFWRCRSWLCKCIWCYKTWRQGGFSHESIFERLRTM